MSRTFEPSHTLLSRVDRTAGPDACWPWTGSRLYAGYGKFEHLGKTLSAHRTAYELAYGPIPNKLLVLHTCDNPPCCNPAHLKLGTQKDNIADMHAKGRAKLLGRPKPNMRGIKHHQAKLTDAIVREIRSTSESTRSLARRFNVARNCIREVRRGVTWKHVI